MLTLTAHGKAIDATAMVDRLNGLIDRIAEERRDGNMANFEYYGGVYDGYREALAAMGCSVVYDASHGIIDIRPR